jgi:hypothetical protein
MYAAAARGCMCVSLQACVHVCVSARALSCALHVCVSVCVFTRSICMQQHVCWYACTGACICMRVCMCFCVCVCMCVPCCKCGYAFRLRICITYLALLFVCCSCLLHPSCANVHNKAHPTNHTHTHTSRP